LETADKQIIFSNHAKIKMADRGVTESDVIRAIKEGSAEPARKDRILLEKIYHLIIPGVENITPLSRLLR